MATDDERRRVAESLRKAAEQGQPYTVSTLACFVEAEKSDPASLWHRLADLIEPSDVIPVEICEIEGTGEGEPLPPIVDRDALLALADKMASFSRDSSCPSCAASGQPECSCGVECRESISHSAARRIREACGEVG